MAETLLVVSGNIPENLEEQVLAGKRPRTDYQVLAASLPADLIDYRKVRASKRISTRIINALAGPNPAMAWECYMLRDKYSVIFTDGEQVGIPFAFFLKYFGRGIKSVRHAMIVHILSVPQKMFFFDRLKIQDTIDRFFVYATYQRNFIMDRWKVAPEKVVWIPFLADGKFFQPMEKQEGFLHTDKPMICSAGLEFRDYPTLMDAVEGLDISVVLAAASPWSKRSDTTQQRPVPENVTVQKYTQFDLRALYNQAKFVVVPLYPVNFQAGVTTILEAMAMGKAVIVTQTPGQTDYIEEGVTGIYVPPADSKAFKSAILQLLDNPAEAARLGANALEKFKKDFNLDHYVSLIKEVLDTLMSK